MPTYADLEINPQWIRDEEPSLVLQGDTDQDIIDRGKETAKDKLRIDLKIQLGLDNEYVNLQGGTLDDYTDRYYTNIQRALTNKQILGQYLSAESCNEDKVNYYTKLYKDDVAMFAGYRLPNIATPFNTFGIMS